MPRISQLRAATWETYPAPKIGIGTSSGRLKPATKLKWMFIGRLDEATTAVDITDYMKETGITIEVCEKLNTHGQSRSFKIGITEDEADRIDTEDFWPQGISFCPYLFT